ncbi:MAG: hypothetical protein AAGN46_01470 [Acidobacteriota bacterium]
MWIDLLWMLAVALVSSIATACVTIALISRWIDSTLRPRLEDELAQRLEEIRRELGDEVERRVKRGVLDAVASLPSREVIAGTTRSVARTGAELLGLMAGRRSSDS